MSRIVRVSDVLVAAGIKIPIIPIITDKVFRTSCPKCNESQMLNQCKVYAENDETFYMCKNGCQPVVIVCPAGHPNIAGKGYRLKDNVIRNISDLYIDMPNGTSVLFPN